MNNTPKYGDQMTSCPIDKKTPGITCFGPLE